MSKETRKVYARGLTVSDIGKVVEYHDIYENAHKVRLTDVGYDGSSTVLKFEEVARVPNNLLVEIFE